MKNQLDVSLQVVDDRVRFSASAANRQPILIDYLGDDRQSHTSLELLLMSAASCLSTAVKMMATRRLRKEIAEMRVTATGIRKEALPTDFTDMTINLVCISEDLTQSELDGLVRIAEETACPVFAMLHPDLEPKINATVRLPGPAAGGER